MEGVHFKSFNEKALEGKSGTRSFSKLSSIKYIKIIAVGREK